ncbi:MAG: hypothetical protein LBS11_05415 [Oscillospiraceae bacterium]|jgi:flagellar biosynthesis/type III secretory pathway protein FliH|nr:hypothetical protein [Oscillospiraceae bacterium]
MEVDVAAIKKIIDTMENWNIAEREVYIRLSMMEWDRKYALAVQAKNEAAIAEEEARGRAAGLAKGLAKGRAEGLAEGRAEVERQFTINAIERGLKTEDIMRATGMTEARVDELRSQAG